MLKQSCSFQLQVCFSMYEILWIPRIKRLREVFGIVVQSEDFRFKPYLIVDGVRIVT